MKTSTKITLNRKTIFSADRRQEDRGDSLLMEALAMIREEGHVGCLVAQIGPGGTIANLSFTKEDKIPVTSGGIVFDTENELPSGSVTVEI
jgi:hypothetical protein